MVDQPGVLATIASLFSDHGVSVEAVSQTVRDGKDDTQPAAILIIVTHVATASSLATTVEALNANDVVTAVVSVLRVEGL